MKDMCYEVFGLKMATDCRYKDYNSNLARIYFFAPKSVKVQARRRQKGLDASAGGA